MVSYFSDIIRDLKDRTQVATDALFDGEGTAEVRAYSSLFRSFMFRCSVLREEEHAFMIGWGVVRARKCGQGRFGRKGNATRIGTWYNPTNQISQAIGHISFRLVGLRHVPSRSSVLATS
jgi:hypothetical protein